MQLNDQALFLALRELSNNIQNAYRHQVSILASHAFFTDTMVYLTAYSLTWLTATCICAELHFNQYDMCISIKPQSLRTDECKSALSCQDHMA